MGKPQLLGIMGNMTFREIPRIATAVIGIPIISAGAVTACSASDSESSAPTSPEAATVERLNVEIIKTYNFNEQSFTQGLEAEEDGRLLVGTGQQGESRIYRTTLDGVESDSHDLDSNFFGEGITRHGDTVWQLTWQAGTAIKRNADDLKEVGRVSYDGEGWGLCSYQDRLIMSDGTDQLRFLDPETFAEDSRISVTLEGQPLNQINELDCSTDANGNEIVYANIFMDTTIARIDPATGLVTGLIDASTLPNNADASTQDAALNNVLNGIAQTAPGSETFYVTGKRWPDLYEVRFVPQS